MASLAVLDIVRKSHERYVYTLTRSDRPFQAGSRVWDVNVDPGRVTRICDDIRKAVEAANDDPDVSGINVTPFVALGRRLFDELLPDSNASSLRRQLRTLQMPLLISTDDPDIHWELMTDEDETRFVGVRLDVGRTLRTTDAPSWMASRAREKRRCLLIANPEENLPAAATEALNLRGWLEAAGVECEYLTGRDARMQSVRERLRKQYDVIHFAGHAEYHGLRLADGEFTTTEIRRLVTGNPVVFVNGCVSSRAIGGLADAFIGAGARLVVGSSFKAPDEGAREFAEKFYQSIFGQCPAGAAMRLAREHVMSNPDWGAAWACFVMYGDPCFQLDLQIDGVQAFLVRIGMHRDDFDAAAARVIERAVSYGVRMGALETAHLLAAAVSGSNPYLRDRFRACNIAPRRLEAAFHNAFKALEVARPRPSGAVDLTYTQNARAILLAAKALAGTEHRRICELDLVRALVRSRGGAMAEIFSGLGIQIEQLDPDSQSRINM
jgi:hypothetical protein